MLINEKHIKNKKTLWKQQQQQQQHQQQHQQQKQQTTREIK